MCARAIMFCSCKFEVRLGGECSDGGAGLSDDNDDAADDDEALEGMRKESQT